MATEDGGKLTDKQIVHLAKIIPNDEMEPLAEEYLDIKHESVMSTESKYRYDPEKFKREVLREWRNTTQGQVKVRVLFRVNNHVQQELCLENFHILHQ